jgi:hypothetical protein
VSPATVTPVEAVRLPLPVSHSSRLSLPLSSRRLLGSAVFAAVGLLVLLHVAVLAYHVALTVVFPYDLDYGEGYVLNDAVRLARGEPIYVDLQQFPMVRSPYPPMFPALWSLVVPLAGPTFWPGRLLAALALLATLGVVAWSARRVRAGIWPVLIAPSVVVASPLVYQWAGYARVDTLAIFLGASAVAVAQWVPGWRGVLAAALLCGLSLWTKQTGVAAAAAIVLSLLLQQPRRSIAFVAIVGVPSLAVAAALEQLSAGQFSRHVLMGNAQNPFSPARMLLMFAVFLALHLPLVAAGVWWSVRALRSAPSPIALYVPLALLSALSVGNTGSSVNYFLEPIVACALAVPFAWRSLPSSSRSLAPFLALVQLASVVHWPNGFGADYLFFAPHGRTPTAADYSAGAAVDAAVRSEPRAVLAEPAGFAVRNGLPVYIQPIDLRAEEWHGRWNSAPLVSALSDGTFGLVVTAYNLLPRDAERKVETDYIPAETIPSADGLTFRLYRPKSGDRGE